MVKTLLYIHMEYECNHGSGEKTFFDEIGVIV